MLTFIHADTGGTNQARTLASRSVAYCARMHDVCDFTPARCVLIRPRHETEAWALADPEAVRGALGYKGSPADLGLPKNARAAERLPDPKETLRAALQRLGGSRRRDVDAILPAIAQRQSINALRRAPSFVEFEGGLTTALKDFGAI